MWGEATPPKLAMRPNSLSPRLVVSVHPGNPGRLFAEVFPEVGERRKERRWETEILAGVSVLGLKKLVAWDLITHRFCRIYLKFEHLIN